MPVRQGFFSYLLRSISTGVPACRFWQRIISVSQFILHLGNFIGFGRAGLAFSPDKVEKERICVKSVVFMQYQQQRMRKRTGKTMRHETACCHGGRFYPLAIKNGAY
jgi:hypothetical protein